ncbi:phenol 2-hydroxylase component b [Bacillus sp. OxB-1]|uniref:flavin reductase family protein n=1 Tax=Bacillus sp. (strain OxB-1) TaxID=98228 RepID=UPI000581ED34|nr:flavin reductase family protein [Bacillus sp. OxB-1]BAQ10971.1 phenol 2-hydroxylase component b [Bacillus sp. OxB-1]
MDSGAFRNAMGKFATGITVITTDVDGTFHGMTANGFMSISLDPQLVAISIGEKAQTLQLIQKSRKFGVSVLDASQIDISKRFAGQTKGTTPFEFDELRGFPLIGQALVQIICDVTEEIQAGDHTIFLGKPSFIHAEDGEPLIFYSGKYTSLQGELV